MPRYVAFLRGVSPQNCRMADLKRCLETAGYTQVRTVLASGNVAFNTRSAAIHSIESRIEKTIEAGLGRFFATTVRSSEYLRALLAADPFDNFRLAANAKPVVTFLLRPVTSKVALPALPMAKDGVRILKREGTEVFTAYTPNEKGPVFMTLLEIGRAHV